MARTTSYWMVVPALFLAGIASVTYLALLAHAPAPSSDPASSIAVGEPNPAKSTALNDRYEAIDTDPYCGIAPEGRPWSVSTTSAEWQALNEEWQAQLGLSFDIAESLVATRDNVHITSWCNYGQEMYITAYQTPGTYDVLVWGGGRWNTVASTTIPEEYAVVKLSTQLYPEGRDTLGIVARVGDASYAKWMYGNVDLQKGGVVWDEQCTHWYGGGWSPYGDEDKLECTARYDG